MNAASWCRSLRFYRCPASFLPTEADRLQSLDLDHCYKSEIQALAKFTGLTHLRLCEHDSTDLHALQSLPLKDLDVSIRTDAMLTLFTANSLTGLKKLHLRQLKPPPPIDAEEQQVLTQNLCRTARTMQSLPSLRAMSGVGTIFQTLVEGYNGWREEKVETSPHHILDCKCLSCLKLSWVRNI